MSERKCICKYQSMMWWCFVVLYHTMYVYGNETMLNKPVMLGWTQRKIWIVTVSSLIKLPVDFKESNDNINESRVREGQWLSNALHPPRSTNNRLKRGTAGLVLRTVPNAIAILLCCFRNQMCTGHFDQSQNKTTQWQSVTESLSSSVNKLGHFCSWTFAWIKII